ncbi:hypothetical protein, partial [Thermococcus sp.]
MGIKHSAEDHPEKYRENIGFYGSATESRPVTWETASKYKLWAVFFDHIALKIAKGDPRVSSALAEFLNIVPTDFEEFIKEVKENPEEHAKNFILFAKKKGVPIDERDVTKIIGAMRAAAEIASSLTAGRDIEEVANILHSAYMSNDPAAVLKKYGIDVDRIRENVVAILKQHELEEIAHEGERERIRTSPAKIPTQK